MERWFERTRDIWVNSLLPVIIFFWIWIITLLFFFKGIDIERANVTVFKIIYTLFALICIISFQFSREFWQKMIIRFWTFVIIYAIFVFFSIFLYQFQSIRNFCSALGINPKWQQDIGLTLLRMSDMMVFVLVEAIIISMVVILQLLLHRAQPIPSMRIQSIEKMVEVLDTFFDITKLTVFGIIMTCIHRVNFIHFCFVIAAVFSMVLKRTIRYIIIQLISVSAAILLVLQMVMQLHVFQDAKNVTCIISSKENVSLSNGAWLGMGKIDPGESMLMNVIGYISVIALVTIYTVVVKEKNIIQSLKQEAGWNPYKMFNDPTYLDADKDFTSYVKYLLKYGFYRYGIEFTLICIAMLIQARLDGWALIYSVWLMIFVLSSTSMLSRIWPIFKYFVLISIPIQYACALGFWPSKCFGYILEKQDVIKNAFTWLNLPLGSTKPDAYNLFWDSLVFLFALCQANVFEFERKEKKLLRRSPILMNVESNPESVIRPSSTFGLVRYSVFCSLPIISAVTFFLAATSGITLFSVGYGICFGCILWYFDGYFLRSAFRTITFWNYLLIFNVSMILLKTGLQIPGCIFMDQIVEQSCLLVQLLGITCLKLSTKTIALFKVPILNTGNIPENSCWFLPYSVGIEWDVFCFISLMFHKRFLRSIYFTEMAKEAILQVKFSHRAAKIYEELNQQQLREMKEKYKRSMEKIQKTMARLKEAQTRIRGLKITEPMSHQEAVTSGDYYMFDDTDKEVKLSTEVEDEEDLKTKGDNDSPTTPNVGKLMEAVMKTDIEQALKIAESGSSSSDKSSQSSKSEKKKPTGKCLECLCKTKEGKEFSSDIAKEAKRVDDALQKQEAAKKQKAVQPHIVIKGEKLLPTINFDRRKSPKGAKAVKQVKTAAPPEEKSKKCACGCENCTCRLKFLTKMCNVFCLTIKFTIAFVNSCMISLCQLFNKIAYDYKYIKKQLDKEKHSKSYPSSPATKSDTTTVTSEKDKVSLSYQVPIYIRLLIASHDLIMSGFNTVCFLSVLLLQMRNPTIFTIPLTMMVLLWGSLSVPRPTKRFWKVILTYTAVLLILESVLRLQLIPMDWQFLNHKYLFVQLFDVERTDNFSIYYLFVILVVFLQRRILMNIGMWSNEPPERRRSNVDNVFWQTFLSVKNFFNKLIYENYNRIPVDIYTQIFLCDFVNIFIFIFGFASITEKKEDGVSRYFSENKIPPAMLVLFITQCMGIFIDRWIYLRKHVAAKLIFQIVQIILIHMCLFLVLPAVTIRKFNRMFFPSLWYGLKSIYFLLSAYQIRRGYPASVHGHALCQSYSVVNMYLYQFYLLFPFVYELRTVTDWMWTETTLTLSEWIGMEDIFCTVFQLKVAHVLNQKKTCQQCWRNYDNKYSYKRGQKITSSTKFTVGGGIVLLFFLLLLFPLAFFTFGRVAGKVNMPLEMQLLFRIGSFDPIYTGYSVDIRSLDVDQWQKLKDVYSETPRASTFLTEYYADDVGIVHLSNYSTTNWNIDSIFKEKLIWELKSEEPPKLTAEWKFTRKTENLKQSNVATGYRTIPLEKALCFNIADILSNNSTTNKFTAPRLSPKFLKVGSLAVVEPIDALIHIDSGWDLTTPSPFINISFHYQKVDGGVRWVANQPVFDVRDPLKEVDNIIWNANRNDSSILIMTFNDKIFPPGLFSYFSAQGIIGLYTTFLISLGFIIRRLCRGRTNQVFLDYLPNVDSILQLLLDIYFVREHKDGKLEEDLYAKLIFLFRSPETLIRWTRMPEESD